MLESLKNTYHGPALNIMIFFLLFYTILSSGLHHTQNHFVYTLDDAYIHMAIAKNLALHRTWGITPYEFSSSSSSMLWTCNLALFYHICGVKDFIPLIINLILSLFIIIFVYVQLLKVEMTALCRFIAIVIISLFTPLLSLVFTGLEHILHTALVLIFITYLSESKFYTQLSPKRTAFFLLISALLPSVRLEALFLIIWAFLFLLIKNRIKTALIMLFCSVFPIIGYGIFSKRQGWFFFPNSIVLKGQGGNLLHIHFYLQIPRIFLNNLLNNPHLFFLIVSAFFITFHEFKRTKSLHAQTLLFILVSITHLCLAGTSSYHFFRYAAYLFIWGTYINLVTLGSHLYQLRYIKPRRYALCLLIGLLQLAACIHIKSGNLLKVPIAMQNIYSQQYQTGLFLAEYYKDTPVLVNDIGLSSYLGEIRTVDLFGLSNIQAARAMLKRQYNPLFIYNMCRKRNVKIGIFYEHWMALLGGVPSPWIHIATLQIKNNVVCGGDHVEFFSIDKKEQQRLHDSLRSFQKKLPPTSSLIFYD